MFLNLAATWRIGPTVTRRSPLQWISLKSCWSNENVAHASSMRSNASSDAGASSAGPFGRHEALAGTHPT